MTTDNLREPIIDANSSTAVVRWNYLASVVVVILIMLLLVEGIATVIYRQFEFADSYHTARNPNFRRGLVTYTSLIPENRAPHRIVLISNSQGFLREQADEHLTYASQLEQMLNANAPIDESFDVLNWSIPGAYAPEYVLLATQVGQHEPDLILLVTYIANFTDEPHPISFYISDAKQLGYRSEARQLLPDDFIDRHQVNDPLLWLQTNTSIGKLSHVLEFPRNDRWRWEATEPNVGVPRPADDIAAWNRWAEILMREFHDTLRASGADAPLIIINMPANRNGYTEEAWQNIESFVPAVEALFAGQSDVQVLDASDGIVPTDLYYGRLHFRPEGHRLFAEWLYDVVNETLALE